MIKKKCADKQITQKICISQRCLCDVCKKEINNNYWEVVTGHNDWGRDSVDSIENYEVCSTECLDELFREYKERSNKRYNTEYFEVSHINKVQ